MLQHILIKLRLLLVRKIIVNNLMKVLLNFSEILNICNALFAKGKIKTLRGLFDIHRLNVM